MRTREDIEAYLQRSGNPHTEVAEDTWIVTDPSNPTENMVVRVADGLVIFRLKLLEVGRIDVKRREEFFEKILTLNAEDMVHGAYGITEGDLIMIATLRLEHLDFTEFSGTLDDFALALSNHYPQLREFIADAA
ncbi:MAG: hypothetical protein AB7S26_40840 [Sandaracinaceae bacterium]